ncbi:MAG TPA: patatin family protein [Candidatus Caccousia avistercoris]|nr:patatin family protein [Candidatus Caccousia avistercoris]
MAVGLVLEGGGTRGAYTSGVLDVLLEEDILIPSVYGISAGACNGVSYVAGQKKRNYNIFYYYIRDERYLSVTSLYKTGSIFGFDFIFGELFHKLVPLDYDAFFSSPIRFYAGATDLNTGKAVFFPKEQMDDMLDPVRASSSLPFVSPIVSCQGRDLLDGGCAMPIPLEQSLVDGNRRNVVVLTRDSTYRKSQRADFPRAVLRVKYGEYPRFVETMMERGQVYNSELDLCRVEERLGRAVVVRPSRPLAVSRYEKDPEHLKAIYEMGIRDGRAKLREIAALLEKDAAGAGE